jgi:hypothetical protein
MAEDGDLFHHQSGGRNDDAWNELNELTLNVMANRTRYDKCKKTIANSSDSLVEIFNTEKQYYKERIIAMTRGLFDEESENAEINEAHRAYLKASIAYLKWNDITEMVETDTRSEVREIDTLAPARSSSPSPSPPAPPSPPSPPAPPPSASSASSASSVLAFANKMCIRKKSMDDFIVIRPSEENSDEKIQARLPKIRDYPNEILKRATSVTRHGDGL